MEYIDKVRAHSLGDDIALVIGESCVTYKELIAKIDEIDGFLGSSVKKGDVVAILSDYSLVAISVLFALASRECVVVPIATKNQAEIDNRLLEVPPSHIVTVQNDELAIVPQARDPYTHELIARIIEERSHSGLILFSSGSTGRPKAMIHDLNTLLETYIGKKKKKITMMLFLLFDHIGGLNSLFNGLAMGSKVVIPLEREPVYIAKLIEHHAINLLPASPSFLNMMLIAGVKDKYNLASLRMITYGTEPMPESLLSRLRANFPKVKLLQTFGTSETGIAQTTSKSSGSLEIKFDDPRQEYKIIEGELWIKSDTQILGYLNHATENLTDDGWFKTGDLVEEKEDGYLLVKGRIKEVINVGGEKVLPTEVESTVMEIEGVSDCIAFAVFNPILGQTVGIKVTVTTDYCPKTLKSEIKKHCLANLERYKVPSKVSFTETSGVTDRFKKQRLTATE